MSYHFDPINIFASPCSIEWPFRLRQELAQMERFVLQQASEDGIHTEAWPCSMRDALRLGIPVSQADIDLCVLWKGHSKLFHDGKRKFCVLLPPRFPFESPQLYIERINRTTTHHILGNNRACLVPDWQPTFCIGCLLAECFSAYAAEINIAQTGRVA